MTTTDAGMGMSKGPIMANWRALLSPAAMALGALLLLQLLAALMLGIGGTDMEPAGAQGPLVAFDGDQVTGIRIDVLDGEPVLVAKTDGGWVIPALGDLPAAEYKVSDLLSKLADLEKGLPVATSDEALKRFKVAEDRFERKLTLEGRDGTLAAIYLGDSPGFRRLFVRADGDDAVYEAQLGLFDAPDKPDAWSDRTLLHLNTDSIQGLTIGELRLERTDDGWRLADLAAGEEQDADAIANLVRALASIDFAGVLRADAKSAIDQAVPPLEIEAVLKSGETVGYRITKLARDDDYLLEASNRPERFKLPAYTAEEMTGTKRDDLLQEAEQATEIPHPVAPSADTADVAPAAPSEAGVSESTGSTEMVGETASHTESTKPVSPEPGTGMHEETAPQREP